jgi:hypothetical protein
MKRHYGTEQARLARRCRLRRLPEPILSHDGYDAMFPDFDLAVVIVGDDPARNLERINRAAQEGWFVLVVTAQEWRDGTALDLVAKVAETCA